MKKLSFKISHILFLVLMLGTTPVLAQKSSGSYEVSGTILDSAGKQPLPYLTVYLETSDEEPLKTIQTDTNGFFRLTGLLPNSYNIVIKRTGVKAKRLNFVIKDRDYDLGKILIENTSTDLKEVKVTVAKPLIKQELDRIIYDIEADPQRMSSSVLEILPKVPFLSLDANQNILLQGSASYKILINGRPSAMMERNANDVLRSMPASSILRVEVITNPPSKYDAEGVAGLINIVTKKRVVDGYNGAVNVKHRFPVGGPGTGGSFAFKQNKFALSAIAGISLNNSPVSNSSVKRISGSIEPIFLNQNNFKSSETKTLYLGSEFSYEFNNLNLLSAQVNVSGNRTSGQNRQLSQKGNADQFITMETNNIKVQKDKSMDLALDYQRGFKNSKNQMLYISYRFMENRNGLTNELDSLTYAINSNIFLQHNQTNLAEHSLQADYSLPLGKITIETGLKTVIRNNNSDFHNLQSHAQIENKNSFNNQQSIYSFYNSMQYKYKSWGIKAGFRMEQTLLNADFENFGGILNRSYLSFIPSVILRKNLGSISGLGFSYTTRVQRPAITQLNPFVDRSNPEFITYGNPNLGRGYTHVFKIDYNRNKKANFNISLGSLLLRNMIGQISTYDEQNKVTYTTMENTSAANVYKTNIYVNYPVSKQFRITLNTDFRYITGEFKRGNETIRNDGFLQYVNLNGNYKLISELQFNAGLTYNSKGFSSLQNRTNAYSASSLGITKDMLKKKLSFSASVNNPFTKFRLNREEIRETGFWQLNNQQVYYRSFSTSINYRFGRLKESLKKSKHTIVNDDLN